MVSSYEVVNKERLALLDDLRETYKPFFTYTADLKKNIFRVSFSINGQDRVVRVDPQRKGKEIEDIIAAVESSKNAIITRLCSEVCKEAKKKLRVRIESGTYMGHQINWTYAFEIRDMEGFMCPEDILLLPIEYQETFGETSYGIKVNDDWEDKAVAYFNDHFGESMFIKRQRCPDSLKDFVVEFAAAQDMIFTKHARYVCQVQQEYIPGKDKAPRFHFEFGDFIEKDGGWEYIKDTGIYSMYDNDKERYMYLYNSLFDAIPSKEMDVELLDGEGLYYGETKFRLKIGPWFKDITIVPDFNDWDGSVISVVKKEVEVCQKLVWNKITKCYDNLFCRDIADVVVLHGKLTLAKIIDILSGRKVVYPTFDRAGIYREYKSLEYNEAIKKMVAAKIARVQDNNVEITPWGLDMFKKYKKTLGNTEERAELAAASFDEGKAPCDENTAALLKQIRLRKKTGDNDEKYLSFIRKNKNVMTLYGDMVEKLERK